VLEVLSKQLQKRGGKEKKQVKKRASKGEGPVHMKGKEKIHPQLKRGNSKSGEGRLFRKCLKSRNAGEPVKDRP